MRRRKKSETNVKRKSGSRKRSNAFRTAQNDELEGILLFKEQPRQFMFLFLVIATVSYYSFTHNSQNFDQNAKSALLSASFIFLTYSFLQTRDGLLVRPHPGVWRIVHGCAVLYLLMLAALSVQNVHSARKALQMIFPEIGEQKKPDMSHLNCEISAQSLYKGVSSIWFVAHVTGWWGKMCMFRDWRFCWVLSIIFEGMELSLQFLIPEFQECWWDSVLLDLFGANLIGMCLGHWTLKRFNSTGYDWSGNRGSKYSFVARALRQFSPFSWSRYRWEVFSSFKRFAQVLFILFVTLASDLNAFFLLSTLNIPKECHANKLRILTLFFLGIPAAAEYYEFLSDPHCWRIGQNAWLMISIVCFEILVWVKFFPEIMKNSIPIPNEVFLPLLWFAAIFFCWIILFFFRQRWYESRKRVPARNWQLDLLFASSFVPLLYLTKQWAY